MMSGAVDPQDDGHHRRVPGDGVQLLAEDGDRVFAQRVGTGDVGIHQQAVDVDDGHPGLAALAGSDDEGGDGSAGIAGWVLGLDVDVGLDGAHQLAVHADVDGAAVPAAAQQDHGEDEEKTVQFHVCLESRYGPNGVHGRYLRYWQPYRHFRPPRTSLARQGCGRIRLNGQASQIFCDGADIKLLQICANWIGCIDLVPGSLVNSLPGSFVGGIPRWRRRVSPQRAGGLPTFYPRIM
jgi:hypothetical protein